MKTVIPLPGKPGQSIIGESRHGRYGVGNVFGFDSKFYQFLGRDATGGLHARRLTDQQLCVFESSREWRFENA